MEITLEFIVFIIAGMLSFSILAVLSIMVSVRLNSDKHYDKETVLISCESCRQLTNMDLMFNDDDSNYFCPECWDELSPTMKQIHEEMVRNGEIEPD